MWTKTSGIIFEVVQANIPVTLFTQLITRIFKSEICNYMITINIYISISYYTWKEQPL